MKKFQFRLQAALDLRRRREEQVRAALAEIQQRLRNETERLNALLAARETSLCAAAEARTGRIDAAEPLAWERRFQNLEESIEGQRQVVAILTRDMEAKKAEAVAATQETRALENLRERHLQEHRREELREEQKFLDELASIRSARQAAAEGASPKHSGNR